LRGTELPEHGGCDRHVALSVTNLDAVIAALQTAGVTFTLSRSGRRALFCRDPDGNAVELLEAMQTIQ
jgi:glyoxylase I family protein